MRRGNEGLDFTPVLTHYLFLFTTILAILAWFIAFVSQVVTTAQIASVGVAWFGIFLELFLIIGVVHTLATDSIATHRLQISVFGSIAIVFAVIAVNDSIYSGRPSLDAMAAGWLILAIVDILWVIFFTSEEDSLAWHVLNSLGTGGLTPPSRRRRSAINLETANGGFPAGYSNVTTDKHSSQHAGMDRESGVQPPDGPPPAPMGPTPPPEPDVGVGPAPEHPSAPHKSAKALYAYTASPDDPNEISFSKGEILTITDSNGKWWQATKWDGSTGIAPSNYLQLT